MYRQFRGQKNIVAFEIVTWTPAAGWPLVVSKMCVDIGALKLILVHAVQQQKSRHKHAKLNRKSKQKTGNSNDEYDVYVFNLIRAIFVNINVF